MDRNFYNEAFEEFLKQKADQHKMYPSDRVWNAVNSSLRNRRRWYSLGFLILLCITTGVVSREMLLNNFSEIAQNVNENLILPTPNGLRVNAALTDNASPLYFTPKGLFRNNGSPSLIAVTSNKAGSSLPEYTLARDNGHGQSGSPVMTSGNNIENNLLARHTSYYSDGVTGKIMNGRPLSHTLWLFSFAAPNVDKQEKPSSQIDDAALDIQPPPKHKWSMQLYASPIVSYRRLSNLNTITKYIPVAANFGNSIDNFVRHKPAIGFELGTKMQYNLSNDLSIFIGTQLNYSRYTIDAYNYSAERATIALNTKTAIDTVASVSSIRNFGGHSPEQLTNQYLQISVPLGAELRLLGENRLQFSIAGSIQPTYLISSNSYLISSDFKNYVKNPDLDRKFNLHTNFEAFVSYKLGGLKWQLGPQFRYQLLSSYSNKYPIREYLTEYGIKLGVTKTIK